MDSKRLGVLQQIASTGFLCLYYYLTMQTLFKSKSGYVTSLLHFTLEHELLGSKAALFDVLLILVRSGLKKSS